MKYPRKFGYVWKKTELSKYLRKKTKHLELSMKKPQTPKNHLDRLLEFYVHKRRSCYELYNLTLVKNVSYFKQMKTKWPYGF